MQETVGWEEVPKGHLLKTETKSEMAHGFQTFSSSDLWVVAA